MLVRWLVIVLAFAFFGCGGDDGASPDAAEPLDAARAGDAGSADGGTADGGMADGGTADAMAPDAGAGDSGVDCSAVDCAEAPVCGFVCDAPCGCCSCDEGTRTMHGAVTFECRGGCYVAVDERLGPGAVCATTDECGSGLTCCYPCGIAGCDNVCEPTCDPSAPACEGGCFLRP